MGFEIVVHASKISSSRALVLGGGVTGRSVASALVSLGAQTFTFDEATKKDTSNALSEEEIFAQQWDFAVVSPGWRMDHPVIKRLNERSVEILSEIDLAWILHLERHPEQKWVAVTGTNGKTTTVELTAAMINQSGLSATACGNVGETVLDVVMGDRSFDILVVELSSFQLAWSKRPHFQASAILNIADDHVDWHGTFENYVDAKVSILDRTDLAVLNADDSVVVRATQKFEGKKVFFCLDTPEPGELGLVEELLIDRAFVHDTQEAMVIAELLDVVPSAPHSVSNTLAAAGIALSVGVSHEAIRQAVKSFRPGHHRIERVGEIGGVTWVDDSKATNPHAAMASLMSGLSFVWIAGGLAKGASMVELVSRTHGRIRAVILIGKDRELIAEQFEQKAPQIPLFRVDPDGKSDLTLMEKVVSTAQKIARSGDTVLLAPACASMDQFISYDDRGNQFREAVNKLVLLQ